MRYYLFTILVLAGLCATVFAAESDLIGSKVQTFAPNGSLTQTLTVNSATVDMSSNVLWSLYTPASTTCYYRLMPSALTGANKTAYKNALIPVSTHVIRAKNPNTPFINMSGCTAGYLERQ